MTESRTEIPVFTEAYTEKLFRNVKITENFENYYNKQFPYEERFAKGPTNIFLDTSFTLNTAQSSDADLHNSIALYETLTLNETQASDPRLWTYLTHVRFWHYMRKRWPLENVRKGDSPLGRITDRYFLVKPNLQTLTRNGISRLWWYAHLTIDKKRKDKYQLTKVLLHRAEISVGILERFMGSNVNTRTSILEFLKDNKDILNNEDLTRRLLRNLNLYAGTKILPLLQTSDIKTILEYIKPTK